MPASPAGPRTEKKPNVFMWLPVWSPLEYVEVPSGPSKDFSGPRRSRLRANSILKMFDGRAVGSTLGPEASRNPWICISLNPISFSLHYTLVSKRLRDGVP